VEITGPPTNPDDGETVVEVRELAPADAVAELERTSDASPLHARVLRDLVARGLLP
jgi:8-oxo-dGTP diphosphatase